MPELAEVYYYAHRWEGLLRKKVQTISYHEKARCFRDLTSFSDLDHLREATLRGIHTHGKQMFFVFSGKNILSVHLGMTGKLFAAPLTYEPTKHDHFILKTKEQSFVFSDYRMFGSVTLTREKEFAEVWASLPTEILSSSFTLDHMHQYLQRRQRQTLKGVLLLQDGFPGVGNWMADEILWRARLLPERQVQSLSQKEESALYQNLREVTQDALRVIGNDWGAPPMDWLFPHRWKAGGTCPKTKKPLARKTIAGRTTCWSPAWQK